MRDFDTDASPRLFGCTFNAPGLQNITIMDTIISAIAVSFTNNMVKK